MKPAWVFLVILGSLFAFAQVSSSQVVAITALEEQLKQNPGDIELMISLGKAYLDAGRNEEAANIFEEALAENYENFSAHFGLGLAMYRKGNLRGAIFEFDQATRVAPDRFEGWYNLGVAYADLMKWSDAADAFSQALSVGSKIDLPGEVLKPAYLGLAAAYRKMGKPDQAAEVLNQALETSAEDIEVLFLLADNLSLAGKPKDAIPFLYKVLQQDRAHVAAVSLLADIYVGQGLPDRALREIDRSLAVAQTPRVRANLLLKKANILKPIDAQKAAELLQEASRIDPSLWQAHYDLGISWLKAGDPDQALRSFQRAYSVRPNEPKILVGLAAAYYLKQDFKQAYFYAQLAAASDDDQAKAEALLIAGKSAYNLGRFGEARALLIKAVEAMPDRADAWLWLGLSAYAMQDYKTAISALEQSVQIEPAPVAKLNLGAAYLAVKRFSDAEQIFTQVVLEEPKNAEAWYNLGWALKALGREAEAQRAWKRALELGYEPARSLIK